MVKPLLYKKFPELGGNIPWLSVGTFPTPVGRLYNLEKAMGLSDIWIKRDDLCGELYGGNKVRTLEFSLADAIKTESELIFTYSALGSNWPLACVIYSKLHNIPTDVFFLPYPMDPVKEANLRLTHDLANRVFSAKSLFTFPWILGSNLIKAKRNRRVYLMPPGGVSAVTTLGYINAVLELKEQCDKGEMPIPDFVFCALGSGGTAAGLSIGLGMVGWSTQVVAVRVVDLIVANRLILNRLIRKTLAAMKTNGARLSSSANWGANIRIEHRYFGKGYGVATVKGDESIEVMRSEEDQLLDTTYTAKACGAMLEMAHREPCKGKTLLFWQTLNSRPLDEVAKRMASDSS